MCSSILLFQTLPQFKILASTATYLQRVFVGVFTTTRFLAILTAGLLHPAVGIFISLFIIFVGSLVLVFTQQISAAAVWAGVILQAVNYDVVVKFIPKITFLLRLTFTDWTGNTFTNNSGLGRSLRSNVKSCGGYGLLGLSFSGIDGTLQYEIAIFGHSNVVGHGNDWSHHFIGGFIHLRLPTGSSTWQSVFPTPILWL